MTLYCHSKMAAALFNQEMTRAGQCSCRSVSRERRLTLIGEAIFQELIVMNGLPEGQYTVAVYMM